MCRICYIIILFFSLSSCAVNNKQERHHEAALINLELGKRYFKKHDISKAKEKFYHAIKLDPKLSEAYLWLGKIFEKVIDDGT